MSELLKTRDLLKELNPELFSMRQPSLKHEIRVVGRKMEVDANGEKKTKTSYILKTRPNAKAREAGIKASNYVHISVRPTGAVVLNEDGEREYKGPKRARGTSVNQLLQPELYNFIVENLTKRDDNNKVIELTLEEGEKSGMFKKAGFDAQNRPMVLIKDKLWGRKIVMSTEPYTPHSVDEQGNLQPLKAVSYNPKTGKYEKRNVVISSYQFFADDDDLDNLLDVCIRHYTRNVKPFVVEEKVITTKKGNETTTKLVEAEYTGTEEFIIDSEGNAVDETGAIVKTAEELEEMGISAGEGEVIKLKTAS